MFEPATSPTRNSQNRGTAGTRHRISAMHHQLTMEPEIAIRMMMTNTISVVFVTNMFALSAAVYFDVHGGELLKTLAISFALSVLFLYTWDSSNQVRSRAEDSINKPYRPLPTGLATPRGMLTRYILAAALLVSFSLPLNIWLWSTGWLIATFFNHLIARPRDYIWTKVPTNCLAFFCMTAAAWRLSGPIDSTGWRWLCLMTIFTCLPQIFEDLRDIHGDAAVGRRTPVAIFGQLPVRLFFFTMVAATPVVMHIYLWQDATSSRTTLMVCDVMVASFSWTTAIRALALRSVRSDAITFQLFTVSVGISLLSGIFVWANR
ncbi:UbiA prenyltransferase [Nocardia brasiliensis ATCC 700358]|uniref:UbiA prenyltransferase n=2 Tax=Nocardia brasiliensis TaxID=37326 RepID=K0F4W4_NOCB7|nr:UbiA prenyltransferase [Nocardia brasiliensis ATCC 700358]